MRRSAAALASAAVLAGCTVQTGEDGGSPVRIDLPDREPSASASTGGKPSDDAKPSASPSSPAPPKVLWSRGDTGRDVRELQARLRALLRRSRGIAAPVIRCGRIALDPAARTVTLDGKPVDLLPREFATLEALLLNAGRVLSKAQIEDKLYGWGDEIESNAIEVYVHHLRRKLYPDLIRTVRGVGYFVPKDPT